jgi:hypothetical protein
MGSRSRHGYDTKIVSVTRFDDGVVAEEDLAAGVLLRSSWRERRVASLLSSRLGWFRHHIIVVYALLFPSPVIHRPTATSGVYLWDCGGNVWHYVG